MPNSKNTELQIDNSYKSLSWSRVSTLSDCVDEAAEKWDHDALAFPSERITYPELSLLSDHFARGLIGLNVQRGSKVGVLLAQGIDYLALALGVMKIGAIAIPINPRFKAKELAHVIINSDMDTLMTTPKLMEIPDVNELLTSALPELADIKNSQLNFSDAPNLRQIIMNSPEASNSFISRKDFDNKAEDVSAEEVLTRRASVAVRDTAVIMYTSGTTASPKGAMLSHEGLCRVAQISAQTRFDLSESDRFWSALPLYHIGGFSFFFSCVSVGATYCHTSSFEPESAVVQLRNERCTIAVPGFETIWLPILNHPDFDASDIETLRLIFNVGVSERLVQMQEMTPKAIQIQGYGSTEACAFLSMGRPEESLESRTQTCGRPIPGVQVRIVSPETREPLPNGELGEIAYRGWSRFSGYYNDPEGTSAVIDNEGWFYSGDLGTLDEDGQLTFTSRLKDMLKVGGENVAAAEIEGYLITHPAVFLPQVVSAPDSRYTEVPAAFIQLEPGTSITEKELIDYCLGQIATFKVPRYIRFVDDWPMSGTKIKKYELRNQIANELAEAGITEAPKLRSQTRE